MSDQVVSLPLSIADPRALSTAPGTSDQAKIRDLATQFESLLISQMMKDLKASMVGDGEGDEKGTDGFDTSPLNDAAMQQLGLTLSRAGGFGLAKALSSAMEREIGTTSAAPLAGTPVAAAPPGRQ